MKTIEALTLLVALSLTSALAAPRSDLVAKVAAGELKEARASWWGFATSDGCFEDSGYSLAGVPGFLFLAPDKTWIFR